MTSPEARRQHEQQSDQDGGSSQADPLTFFFHDRAEAEIAEAALLTALEHHRYDATCSFAVRLAIEEALANAFRHGNKGDRGKHVRLVCQVDARQVRIEIEDQGEGFDPNAVPDPTAPENIELPCGRGIVLMRAYMSSVVFHPPGNRVEMRFDRQA